MTTTATACEDVCDEVILVVPERSTYPFDVAFLLGGEPHDLTGATVTIIFRSAAGVEIARTATILDAAGGTARYVTTITDLIILSARRHERWSYSWRLQQGGTDQRSLPIPFLLADSP